jgi:hypothetical protein
VLLLCVPVVVHYWVAVPRGLHPLRPNNVCCCVCQSSFSACLDAVLAFAECAPAPQSGSSGGAEEEEEAPVRQLRRVS